jgi:Flp pilus assembly pilin Flp
MRNKSKRTRTLRRDHLIKTGGNQIMKTSGKVQTISGWRMTVAAFVAGLVGAIPPSPVAAAQSPLLLDVSFSVGSVALQLNITNPVAQPQGIFRSTLHVHIRDDSQTPNFNGDLVAIGNAPDADTLLGGLLPAALIVKQDLFAGMTFEQATADAQTKTGVTVTFFNDPTAVEYAVMLALIIVVCITAISNVSPGLHDDACTIKSNLLAGLAAGGFPTTPPDSCVIP